MFLDASIIVAILGKEADWEEQLARVRASKTIYYFSAITRYEATLALARLLQMARNGRTNAHAIIEAEAAFDSFMEDIPAEEIAISSAIGRGAVLAARTYGKSSATRPPSISATASPTPAPNPSARAFSTRAMISFSPISADQRRLRPRIWPKAGRCEGSAGAGRLALAAFCSGILPWV